MKPVHVNPKTAYLVVYAILLALCTEFAGAAPVVGEVKFAHGAATARQNEGDIRFLGKGMKIEQNDTLTTGQRGFVVLQMKDEARMTLRPNTEFTIEQYDEQAAGESVVLNLFRGGLRSLSGLISKRRPSSYRLKTSVATIGIRGTEFDVRICEDDCAREASGKRKKERKDLQPLAGRVLLVRGEARAESIEKKMRKLSKGGRVYMGDAILTGPKSFAVIVFRDDTRMVVKQDSRFVIDQYYFAAEQAEPSAIFRLVRGGLRALTGSIGKRNRRGFRVTTSVSTIGIRGTGFDLHANEHCDEAGEQQAKDEDCAFVHVWEGAIEADGELVDTGEAAYVADADSERILLDETPSFISDTEAPRPDQLEVNLDELFGTAPADEGDPGIYVSVYDGEAYVDGPDGQVPIAVGEAVRIDPETGTITRLAEQPLFLLDDPYPLPSEFDERIENAFELFGDDLDGFNNRDSLECRIN